MSKLKKALSQQKKQTQLVEQEIYGSLGIPLGGQRVVNVANRQGFVYVKLRDNQSEVIQAFNNQVAASYDLPVVVVRTGNKYTVRGVNTERYQNNSYNPTPLLPSHGSSHSFVEGSGGDTTWVFSRQNMPLLVHPSRTTGSIVEVAKHPMQAVDGSWKLVGGTGTSTLLTYRPTGTQAIMTLVYMDAQTGNPGLLVGSGTPFDNVLTGSNSIYQYIPRHNPATQIPLAAVRMDTGTYSLGWENLYDLRQWVQVAPTGSASTPGTSAGFGVVSQDEGVFLGTGSVLNFVGAGVSATISGSVIQVSVFGGSGGGGVDQIGVYGQNNGVPLGTGTVLNVNGTRLSASISGTVLNLTNSPEPMDNIGLVAYRSGTILATGTAISFGNGISVASTGTILYVNAPRESLLDNRTYYVRTDGSDSNTGLTNTADGAFLTIQKAVDVIAALDISTRSVTIQVADGTYTGPVAVNGPWVGSGDVTLKGNASTPANVVISTTSNNAVACRSGGRLIVQDLELRTTTTGECLYAVSASSISFTNIRFGTCASSHIWSTAGSSITATGNYSIVGGAGYHLVSTVGGSVFVQNKTITLTGTPNFTTAFAVSTIVGSMLANGDTFSGSATGQRYLCTTNGVIQTNGGGANYFPGNSAGSTASGGQYA